MGPIGKRQSHVKSTTLVNPLFCNTPIDIAKALFCYNVRGWCLCEIMDQSGAGFDKPGQQQRLLFPVEAEQDVYIKEICSPEGLIFNPAKL